MKHFSRHLVRRAVVGAFVGVFALSAFAQDFRIGFVNTDRIFREASVAKAAQTKLEAEFSRRERDLNEQTARLKAAAQSLDVPHGMGLISHEAPFLMTNHPVAYEGTDAANPLEEGMILSVETTMLHPRRGFIKLEDTLAVTATGYELFGSEGRGWNRGGTR